EFIEGQGDPLPHLLRLGVAYEFASQKTSSDTDLPVAEMLLSFEYQNILNSDDNIWEWGAGAELKMLGIAVARVGY
ncbi:MAG: hypothetical protein GWN55_01495, partial [Phycisphaerae bacterium]|nr:hypothetical protein [candidate division KSB1 bacterium]NIV00006.1 hypothetical protein [Phycisphaerae bacterium]NIS23026.1 hypothetical protein [candidate division KSB1 bacterium]NIT69884.1 hypothetical protein [candidate division KSB1 bacterium]NIU23533.1 hypothetical protein [candidate division KSB1 bacterium]